MDPNVISAAFEQLQQVKSYYQFSGLLVDGQVRGRRQPGTAGHGGRRTRHGAAALRPEQLGQLAPDLHPRLRLRFRARRRSQSDGNPQFTESDIPPTGQLGNFEPRVYFGNEGVSYVIADTRQAELRLPARRTSAAS